MMNSAVLFESHGEVRQRMINLVKHAQSLLELGLVHYYLFQ